MAVPAKVGTGSDLSTRRKRAVEGWDVRMPPDGRRPCRPGARRPRYFATDGYDASQGSTLRSRHDRCRVVLHRLPDRAHRRGDRVGGFGLLPGRVRATERGRDRPGGRALHVRAARRAAAGGPDPRHRERHDRGGTDPVPAGHERCGRVRRPARNELRRRADGRRRGRDRRLPGRVVRHTSQRATVAGARTGDRVLGGAARARSDRQGPTPPGPDQDAREDRVWDCSAVTVVAMATARYW